jgi:hypothetical protein
MIATAPQLRVTWRPLLRIEVTHEYWPEGFTDYALVPFPQTAELCRRFGLKLTRRDGGPTLLLDLARAKRTHTPVTIAAIAEATLCWEIRPTSSEFFTTTIPAFAAETRCLVLTAAHPGWPLRLTAKPSASAADLWPRRALRFDYQIAKPLPDPDGLVTLDTGEGTSPRQLLTPWEGRIAVDTTAIGSSTFRLIQSGRELDRWFGDERLPAPAAPGPIFALPGGVIVGALTESDLPADDDLPATFHVNFTAESTVWRYHLYNTGTAKLEILPSRDFDREVLAERMRDRAPGAAWFRELKQTVVPEARTFEATAPWPLRHTPPENFELHSNLHPQSVPLPLPSRRTQPSAYADVFFRL